MNTVIAVDSDQAIIAKGHVGGRAAYDFLVAEVVKVGATAVLIEDRKGARWKLSKVRRQGSTSQGYARSPIEVRMVGVGSRQQPYVSAKAARLVLGDY